jgi:CDP-glucose 4,6-dehydratase
MLNRSFWKGRRVFLTGHTGFKGSWLSLWLESLGAKVTGFALDPPTQPNLFELAGVARSINSIRGDIRDFPALKNALAVANPEVVLGLVGKPTVRLA